MANIYLEARLASLRKKVKNKGVVNYVSPETLNKWAARNAEYRAMWCKENPVGSTENMVVVKQKIKTVRQPRTPNPFIEKLKAKILAKKTDKPYKFKLIDYTRTDEMDVMNHISVVCKVKHDIHLEDFTITGYKELLNLTPDKRRTM